MDTMNAVTPLVEQLTQRQAQEGWTDREMADELGLSTIYWRFLRVGDRPLSINVVRRIVRRFPEYETLAIEAVRDDILSGAAR